MINVITKELYFILTFIGVYLIVVGYRHKPLYEILGKRWATLLIWLFAIISLSFTLHLFVFHIVSFVRLG